MDYVYTISYRGVVFYVGSSGQPLNRFYYHVSGNNLYTRFRVYEILKKGNFPKLTIVYHSPDKKEVLKKERELIKQMYESGANIVNVRGNKNFVKISKIKSIDTRIFKQVMKRPGYKKARLYFWKYYESCHSRR